MKPSATVPFVSVLHSTKQSRSAASSISAVRHGEVEIALRSPARITTASGRAAPQAQMRNVLLQVCCGSDCAVVLQWFRF